LVVPVVASNASTSVVFPDPAGPTSTTFRMASGEAGCAAAASPAPVAAFLVAIYPLLV
jgi:hypothetical protein